MGLDQFAYTRLDDDLPENVSTRFTWRKHAKLHEFMEALFEKKTAQARSDLNCGELELTKEDITTLRELVQSRKLPNSEGGFFYGHQFQEESVVHYRAQDLEFCNWALAEIENGNRVYYTCWW